MEIKSSENLSMKNMLGIFNKSQTSDFFYSTRKKSLQEFGKKIEPVLG